MSKKIKARELTAEELEVFKVLLVEVSLLNLEEGWDWTMKEAAITCAAAVRAGFDEFYKGRSTATY